MSNIVKTTTIISPLDLIAPHSCRGCGRLGNPICNRCKSYINDNRVNICPICKAPNPSGQCPVCAKDPSIPPLPPTYTIGKRSDLLDAIIHDYKYHSVRALARPLAELIDNALPIVEGPVYIVPLPTIHRHIRERALDHTFLIAKHLAHAHANYRPLKLLVRTNNSVQVGSDARSRTTQAKSAYAINPKIAIDQNATYILLDDVWTTGASLRAATDLLRSANIDKIILAVLAISCN